MNDMTHTKSRDDSKGAPVLDVDGIRRRWNATGAPGVSTLETRGLEAEEYLLALCDEVERLRKREGHLRRGLQWIIDAEPSHAGTYPAELAMTALRRADEVGNG
jgi:hypothetical protein